MKSWLDVEADKEMQMALVEDDVADAKRVVEEQCLSKKKDKEESDISKPVLLPSIRTILARLK